MIFVATVRADALAYGIKACTTARAMDRGNGEAGRFHVGGISPEDDVDTVTTTFYRAILFAVVDPPGTEIQTQTASFHVDIVNGQCMHIGHFDNVPKVWI